MSHVLTLKLSFFETVVLCKALSMYVDARTDDDPEEDKAKAMEMLRGVERALERGPIIPSPTDQRRLHDGATALEASSRPAKTITEVCGQLEIVGAGIAALQSLDDIGPVANDQASRDEQELWKRRQALEQHLKELEGKQMTRE